MSDAYIGQRCNCCGKVLAEGDEYIICPGCFRPHHISCWMEKQGCSTPGCEEQSPEEKARLERQKRAAAMAAAEEARRAAAEAEAPAFREEPTPPKKKKGKGLIALAVIAAIFAGIFFFSPKKLLERGDYKMAITLSIAPDSKRDAIMENAVAYCSAKAMDGLKDPSSFELIDAWYKDGDVVLNVRGTNSFGGKVSNYWLYTYETNKDEFNLYTTFSDLDEKEYKSYDDTSELAEKLLYNAALNSVVKPMVKDSGCKLSKAGVKRINDLFKADKLIDIDLALPDEYPQGYYQRQNTK